IRPSAISEYKPIDTDDYRFDYEGPTNWDDGEDAEAIASPAPESIAYGRLNYPSVLQNDVSVGKHQHLEDEQKSVWEREELQREREAAAWRSWEEQHQDKAFAFFTSNREVPAVSQHSATLISLTANMI